MRSVIVNQSAVMVCTKRRKQMIEIAMRTVIVYQSAVMVCTKRRKQTIEIAMRTVIVYQASVREGAFSLFFIKDAALPEEMTS